MRRHFLVASLLASLFAFGEVAAAPAPPAATGSAPASSATAAPQPSPADQKRIDAIHQYQHDLVNVVALRTDPAYLLGAAMLTRPFTKQIPALGFDALSARASGAPNAGPATYWVRLGVCSSNTDCPNTEAYAYLKKHAAGNAAVWVVALDVAAAAKDAKAEQAALAQAAAAQTYDDYYGKTLAGVVKAVGVLPPLADTTAGASAGQPDSPDGVRVFVAFTATQDYPRPNLAPVLALCGPKADGMNALRKADCLKLAHTLQWGSSPVARATGLHLQAQLDPTTADTSAAATRDLAWQVQQYSRLLQHALVDPTSAAAWLAHARSGGTELSLILATLRANHIATEAPADFQSTVPAGSSH